MNKNSLGNKFILPKVEIDVANEKHKEYLTNLVEGNNYSKIISIILNRFMNNPNLFVNNQSLMSKQITEIGKAIIYIGQQQADLITTISDNNKLIFEMNDALKDLTAYSNKQEDTIQKTFELLSKSEEGLDILSKLKDTNIDLEGIISDNKPKISPNLSDKVKEVVSIKPNNHIVPSNLFISPSTEEEDGDLLGSDNLDADAKNLLFTSFLTRNQN